MDWEDELWRILMNFPFFKTPLRLLAKVSKTFLGSLDHKARLKDHILSIKALYVKFYEQND